MADSVTASAFGNWCTLTVGSVAVVRVSDDTIRVSVDWSTNENATKASASINGTTVHESSGKSYPTERTDSGTYTFTVPDSNKKEHTGSFSIGAAARYGSSGAWEWTAANDTCDYTVPSSAPELFVHIGGTVLEADAVYVNAPGGIAEADAVFANAAGAVAEA